MKHFTLTADHIKLLKSAYVTRNKDPYWGTIGIDCKRPFGDSGIAESMAKILGIAGMVTDDGLVYPAGTADQMFDIYKELETALEIVLATGSFEPGEYQASDYDRDWRRVTADAT